ncbi:hypothetical protein HYALB_00011423 [Hymenoscyphus albidus]|uniref:Uncharacterized protein n=1 Tax=Hymenoscyphus albidus TaxID=595503 RepID=A0A9N9LPM6_9HELO|nr:hypothetical protein HYALB_00011423 [Hymenoscyphus albidus]
MAHYGGSGVPEWNPNMSHEHQHTPRDLTHKGSSRSAISDMSGSPEFNSNYSFVSAMSNMSSSEEPPPPFSPLSSKTANNISHDHLSNIEGSGVQKTASTSTLNKISASLPNTLRSGSIPSSIEFPSTPSRRGFGATTSYTAYSPERARRPSLPSKNLSRKHSRKNSSISSGRGSSIPENEEINMGLLNNAMPLSFNNPVYSDLPEEDEVNDGGVTIDISSFTGPMGMMPKSEAEWEEMHQKERGGQLTGGLGAGFTPDATLTGTQILGNGSKSMPTTPIVRKFSLSGPITRAATVRRLAQSEANKSGKIIEVIAEEVHDDDEPRVDMDLSMMEGMGESTRSTTFVSFKNSRTMPLKPEIYYPQPNWKPLSMRWPFLTALIVVSVLLAVVQEVLYRKSAKEPLFSFVDASHLANWDYFTFKYMPTIVAVTFGILWQFTDFEVKRLEPFYQLSTEGGALAAESLNVDYITFFDFFRPLKALRLRHHAVATSSLATLLAVSLVPTIQSASITIQPARQIRHAKPDIMKTIQLDPVWSRLLTAQLLIVAAIGCVLFFQLEKRRSGLVADVKGIAGIAAMANKSHILMDFKDMDTATPEEIHNKLKKHRYTLRNSSLAPDQDNLLSKEEQDKYDQKKIDPNPQPFMLRLAAGIPFIISMLVLMIIIPVFLFQDKANRVLENAPWLLTVYAVAVKLAWGTLETDVRMIEPFYILSKRHASPKVLTLDYTGMAFGYMPIRAFLNGHFTVFFVGLGSVLAEILTVLASSFGNVNGTSFIAGKKSQFKSGEETLLSFWVSFALALFILTFLIGVAIVVYMRRRHPFLPRQPSSISSVLAFIHQSRMLYDFVDTEKMNNDEMVRRLAGIGKTYGLGWFAGRDGNMHCGVDQEELASDYIHGKDGKQTNQPWNSNWQDY